jgi:hypothetical protein
MLKKHEVAALSEASNVLAADAPLHRSEVVLGLEVILIPFSIPAHRRFSHVSSPFGR